MSLFGFIILLIIAAVCGSIGQAIAGFSRGGCLIAAIVGFIGAFLGMWLAQQLGLPEVLPITIDGETFPVLWSIIGSALFSAILSLLSGRRGRRTA
ncbi:MAG: GlsB/YeaQ/YmgE family stress response membrane protein [Candidatus Promineifilaceae bacterium]